MKKYMFYMSVCGGLYLYNMPRKKTITIKEKYDFQKIKTMENEEYDIVTPISYFSSYPLWWKIDLIPKNEKIEIKYFGINYPLLGFYPKVYEINNEEYWRNIFHIKGIEDSKRTKKLLDEISSEKNKKNINIK
jgi:hypothetical protein